MATKQFHKIREGMFPKHTFGEPLTTTELDAARKLSNDAFDVQDILNKIASSFRNISNETEELVKSPGSAIGNSSTLIDIIFDFNNATLVLRTELRRVEKLNARFMQRTKKALEKTNK